MLTDIFASLIEVSITIGIVIFVLMMLSSLLNKIYGAKWKCWVWMILAVRLIFPFNFSFPQASVHLNVPEVQMGIPQNLQSVNAELIQSLPIQQTSSITESATYTITLVQVGMMVWLAGFLMFLLYQFIGYQLFRKDVLRWSRPIQDDQIIGQLKHLSCDMKIKKQIVPLVSEKVSSPMMLGFIKPILFLPYEDYNDTDFRFILKHELVHFQRHDIWYKLLILLANAIHWFNPLVYWMFREASKDMELSCDDEVVKGKLFDDRKQYSETILTSIHRQYSRQTTLSTYFYGGAKIMKERFSNILNMKKRRNGTIAFLTVLVSVVLIGGLVACSTQNAGVDNVEPDTTPVNSDGLVLETTPADSENSNTLRHYQSSSDFLNSPEGVKFQIAAQKFARAFFSADEEGMKEYLIDSNTAEPYEDVFDDLEYLILKWSPSDIKSERIITASYEFKLAGEDSASYLSLEMEKVDNNWKVSFYGLEK